jgi:hypothetical protein
VKQNLQAALMELRFVGKEFCNKEEQQKHVERQSSSCRYLFLFLLNCFSSTMEAAPPAGELGGCTHTSKLAIAEPRPRGGRTLCRASSHHMKTLLLSAVAASALDGIGAAYSLAQVLYQVQLSDDQYQLHYLWTGLTSILHVTFSRQVHLKFGTAGRGSR